MRNDKAKITVIGSYAVAMTICCQRFPKDGETIKGSDFRKLHGGKGSNQAIGVARMGGKAYFGCCLGKDTFGDEALAMLNGEGIDTSSVKRVANASTGVGLIYVAANGQNEIVIDFGANDFILPEDVDSMEKVIAESDLLLVQLEANNDAVMRAIEIAKARGVPSILNPAPFCPLPDEVVKKTSYITPNETEAASMLGLPGMTDGRELAHKLFEKYAVSVVVTLGEKGAYIKTTSMDELVPAVARKAIDTTGAGDVFSSALAVALGEKKDLRQAVKFANSAAGLSVMVEGVVESIPHRKAVDEANK